MRRAVALGAVVAMGAGALAACGGASTTSTALSQSTAASKGPHRGGTLTVLEGIAFAGDWSDGLTPSTNSDGLANDQQMNAIYGELFQLGAGGRTIDDLASGYTLTNGDKTLTIHIRPGVEFTDGTPLDATAVVTNFEADMAGTTPSKPPWSLKSITATGPDTVVVQFTAPDSAAVNQMQDSNVNWIASPTAEKKLGATDFARYPVGAGPFEVVSDTYSTKLVLKANPHYWQKGLPYLSGLIFETTDSDETALEALESHEAQAYQFMSTASLVKAYKAQHYTVFTDQSPAASDISINTQIAPFNNIKAREAIYYATDAKVIAKDIDDGYCTVTESFTGPTSLFYIPTVPGYRTYDLAKAKQLVKQLGGLKFTLLYLSSAGAPVAESLQTMFEDAGMTVKLKEQTDLTAYIEDMLSKKWEIEPSVIGSWDPAGGTGVEFNLESGSTFTGVDSSRVDQLMAEAEGASSHATRDALYRQLAYYLSQHADLPFICSGDSWDIAVKGVEGPGLTSSLPGINDGPMVLWQDVSMDNS